MPQEKGVAFVPKQLSPNEGTRYPKGAQFHRLDRDGSQPFSAPNKPQQYHLLTVPDQ